LGGGPLSSVPIWSAEGVYTPPPCLALASLGPRMVYRPPWPRPGGRIHHTRAQDGPGQARWWCIDAFCVCPVLVRAGRLQAGTSPTWPTQAIPGARSLPISSGLEDIPLLPMGSARASRPSGPGAFWFSGHRQGRLEANVAINLDRTQQRSIDRVSAIQHAADPPPVPSRGRGRRPVAPAAPIPTALAPAATV